MANSPSALKRIKQSRSSEARNRALRSRVKTLRKKILETSNKEQANSLSFFYSAVDKAVKRGAFHSNKGANLKRRVIKAIKAS